MIIVYHILVCVISSVWPYINSRFFPYISTIVYVEHYEYWNILENNAYVMNCGGFLGVIIYDWLPVFI